MDASSKDDSFSSVGSTAEEEEQSIATQQNSVSSMSDKEMHQHIQLCLKLSAENKINMKNAFGLHLIGIMQKLVQAGATDLQLASLALQASSKIYTGRVDVLYRDAYKFQSHLQSVFNTGPQDPGEHFNPEMEENDEEPVKRKQKISRNRKNAYLATEDSLMNHVENKNNANVMPHNNYVTIHAAYLVTRTAPKLLECLQVHSDEGRLNIVSGEKSIKPTQPVTMETFKLSQKCRDVFQEIMDHQNNESQDCGDAGACQSPTSFRLAGVIPPQSPGNFTNLFSDFHNASGDDISEPNDAEFDGLIERFSVMDITADVFANEISQAVVSGNAVDQSLLPRNSVLQRVVKDGNKSRLSVGTETKKKREPKPREPFFGRDCTAVFSKGRRITHTQNTISKFNLAETTSINKLHENIATLLSGYCEEGEDLNAKELKAQKFCAGHFRSQSSMLFIKEKEPWKQRYSEKKRVIIRPSAFDPINKASDTGSSSNMDMQDLVNSLQNVSVIEDDGQDHDSSFTLDAFVPEDPPVFETESAPQSFVGSLQEGLVTAPEMVKPVELHYQTKPLQLNTEEIKVHLWDILQERFHKNEKPWLSELLPELQSRLRPTSDQVPLQIAFLMVLFLSNEKILFLQNNELRTDVQIRKDVLK